MNRKVYPYQLQFKYPFKIAHGLRTATDVVYIELSSGQYTGYGEASLPPYLPETADSVIAWLNSVELHFEPGAYGIEQYLAIKQNNPVNMPALAALDMALWDLKCKSENGTFASYQGIDNSSLPLATFTLGISSKAEMQLKINDALNAGFSLFKIKLNGVDDVEMISNYKSITGLPFMVDYNQALHDVTTAIEKIKWLEQEGCLLVEQPLQKQMIRETGEMTARGILPIYADESYQTQNDLQKVRNAFNGVNIKLMKSGGLTPATSMINEAQKAGLKVLIGCMSESSVGCSAAAQLAGLCTYADLDGPYLVSNDNFKGVTVTNGRIAIMPVSGIGVLPL